jgi:hypothetical protein
MAIGGAETSQHQFGGTMTEPINEETTDETGIVDDGNDPAFSPDSGGDVEAPPSDLSEAARSGGDVEAPPSDLTEAARSGGDVEAPPADFSALKRSGGDVEFGRSGGDVESPSDGSEGGGS